jgi:hypothetical protein
MTPISQLKAKLGKAKVNGNKVVLDLTLAEVCEVEADKTYLARVKAARFIHLEEKTSKIDLCVEILTNEGARIGIINDNLFTSIRALPRLRDLLLSAGLEADAKSSALDPYDLCERLPEKRCGVLTREALALDGSTRVEIARFIPIDAIEEVNATVETEAA